MSTGMYVCVHMPTHTYVCVQVHVCMSMYEDMCTCIFVCVHMLCVYCFMHTCVHVCLCAWFMCMHVCMYVLFVHKCMCMLMCVQVHTCMYESCIFGCVHTWQCHPQELIFETRSLTRTLGSLIALGWLASKPKGSTCPLLQGCDYQNAPPCLDFLFFMISG